MMKTTTFILGAIIALAILFYPQSTIGKLTGSPGGQTGSPMDNSDCTSCHNVTGTTVSTTIITSNIPSTGYVPGNIYTITSNLNIWDGTGFEITCEENINNTKTGTFFNTNPIETQLVNNGTAITHTANGIASNSWSFDWEAPAINTGDVTFYGAFITAGYPIGSNLGDNLTLSTLNVSEFIPTTAIQETTTNKYLFKIINQLGRQTNAKKNEPLFYIYDDGTVEKKIIIE